MIVDRSFLQQLKQRKLVRWTAAYVAGAAALFGTLETIGQVFEWPPGLLRALFFLLLAGLIATVVLAWFHGEKGRQRTSVAEVLLLCGAALFGVAGAAYSAMKSPTADEATERPVPAVVDSAVDRHFQRGEHALRQRTPASVVQAISAYRSASALDPGHAAALAREAYAYALFVDWGWTYPGLTADELVRRGIELSERALRVDSLSAEVWLARAYLLQLRDPQLMRGAIEAYGRAVMLDPANAEAQHQYAQTLMALGRYTEAKIAYHTALAVEPERPLTLVPLAAIALREGDIGAARRWADSAVVLAREAPYPWASRAQLRLALGDAAGARTDAERALAIDPSYEMPGQSALAAALASLGENAVAGIALDRARRAMVRPDAPTATEAYYLAAALVHMERLSDALDVLEAARPRGAWLWFYFQSPTFDEVRDDSRFRAVMQASRPAPPA